MLSECFIILPFLLAEVDIRYLQIMYCPGLPAGAVSDNSPVGLRAELPRVLPADGRGGAGPRPRREVPHPAPGLLPLPLTVRLRQPRRRGRRCQGQPRQY